MLNQPGTQRLKLEYDKLLSSLALNFKLGRCTKAHCMHPHDIPGDYNGARAALFAMIRATVNINRRVAIFMAGAYTRTLFGSM